MIQLCSMIPFSFQKEHKKAGCEDAPPVAEISYSIVCDGLGGSGLTKVAVVEDSISGQAVDRTNAYLGARIVSKCTAEYFDKNICHLSQAESGENMREDFRAFVLGLKSSIMQSMESAMERLHVVRSSSPTFTTFPTTLASVIYIPYYDKVRLFVVWAGDSRVFLLTHKYGLQQLSADDARDNDRVMNGSSEMTNCISASRDFWLNYTVYEMKEPGIVFCCTDGCFKYLQSPLHFEWLLLNAVIEYLPESEGLALGDSLATIIGEKLYAKIGDDTTMAGIIVGIESNQQMKQLFSERMAEFGESAINMNARLKELKSVQNEMNEADKTCRLLEESIVSAIHDKVCNALKTGNMNSILNLRLMSLPFYQWYLQEEGNIASKVESECTAEIQKMRSTIQQTKEVCRRMFICDYLKYKQAEETLKNYPRRIQFPVLSGRIGEQYRYNQGNIDLKDAQQFVLTCKEMYNHPCFKEMFSLSTVTESEIEKCVSSQTELLDRLLFVIKDTNPLFADLWSQASYSTEKFTEQRAQCEQDYYFDTLFNEALLAPYSSQCASKLTAGKITEYNSQIQALVTIKEKYQREKRQRIDNLSEDFWLKYMEDILEWIMSENEDSIRIMLADDAVLSNKMISYIQAKKTLTMKNQKISVAQNAVDSIWEQYRTDYQLFGQNTEKGRC